MERIQSYLAFIREVEGLKSVLRTAWTAEGRQESTAEHSYRLTLFASILLSEYPQFDAGKILGMCLVHDLGERYDGDISAALCPDPKEKYAMEKAGVTKLFSLLPEKLGKQYFEYWEEYDQGMTKEAKFVKALDKAETILQHNQGKNPDDFDYQFNLSYGKEYFMDDELLSELRALLDAETQVYCIR